MIKNLLIVVGWLTICNAIAKEEIVSGKVMTVIDGNTIEITSSDNETYRILLDEIDCPELGQNFGDHAKKYLETLLLNKSVTAKIKGKDRWGNRLGIIVIEGEIDPRLQLLEQGLAWTSEKNAPAELELIKEKARADRKGLWKEQNPTPPWVFRRQQTMKQPKSS